MARKIAQFRFFGDASSYNNVTSDALYTHIGENTINISSETLSNGSALQDYAPIIQLGVQTLPGVKFYLNANQDPIIVGSSGIYELDLSDTSAVITSIKFDMPYLNLISKNPDGYLIIDIVYEEA